MLNILFAVAAIANIGSFIFQLLEFMRDKRTTKGDKVGTGGNQSR
jgi:hypothetical protein